MEDHEKTSRDSEEKGSQVGINKHPTDSMESLNITPECPNKSLELPTNSDNEVDSYAYVKRPGFTSEVFKIEIHHLPVHASYAQLKKLLDGKLKLKPHKIKVIEGRDRSPIIVFVTFRSEADRENALQCLENYEYKGQKLNVKKANPMEDPMAKKRRAGTSEDAIASKKPKYVVSSVWLDQEPVSLKVRNAVTPLWQLDYQEQLERKHTELTRFMNKWNKQMCKAISLPRYQSKTCTLGKVSPSPVTDGYRNKCEFNIGLHLETAEKTVGFRISKYKEGSKSVAEADGCANISQQMLDAAKDFQSYIRESDKAVFNPENHEGYWRQLTVRSSRNGDLMLIVVLHPQALTLEELTEEKCRISDFLVKKGSKMSSLFVQAFPEKSQKEPPFEHVWGKEFIEETLFGMKFRVSPQAFFQVNTLATEVLYNTIEEVIGVGPDTTILDLCCGTGTIGLTLAKKALKIVGVELCPNAIADARYNAKSNEITNSEFICARVEDVIFEVLNRVKSHNVVAIVDPPRAGLHNKVIKAIRSAEKITKLVYVSCSPDSAINNFIDLGRPTSNNYRGIPFKAKKAIPIDLFPHTPHCELVILFERD